MDAAAGYVYILINPALNGIVKIGKTQNNPEERAKELSSATGVPAPFFVAYASYFQDCRMAEKYVHTRLVNHRLAQNREFFRVSIQQAIEAVREAESTLEITSPELSADLKDKLDTYYVWREYQAADDIKRKKILKDLNLAKNLSLMSWKRQVSLMENAPD